jgi:hypothetical protein
MPSSVSTQPAIVSIFKKSDKIHKFSDFFQELFWFLLSYRNKGYFKESGKYVTAEQTHLVK